MKVWNKETRNADGEFFRQSDWGIDKPDDFLVNHPRADNFTSTPIIVDEFGNVPKQDWDEASGEWVEDATLTTAEGAKELIERLYTRFPERRQIHLLWEALEAHAKGEQLPQAAKNLLAVRQSIKDRIQ